MIDYANNCSDCRSVNIARYFNDAATPPCGKCDNCKKLIKTPLTAKDFERIITTIDHQFHSQSFTQKELMEALKRMPRH
jgi:ATP-dependent DNA helicase RecQ